MASILLWKTKEKNKCEVMVHALNIVSIAYVRELKRH